MKLKLTGICPGSHQFAQLRLGHLCGAKEVIMTAYTFGDKCYLAVREAQARENIACDPGSILRMTRERDAAILLISCCRLTSIMKQNRIREQGIVQPLIVRQKADYYELIAGERRWRAA